MGTIAWANASHCLIDNVFGICVRDRLAGSIYFRKVLPEFVRDFKLPLMRKRSRFEGADADRFAILDAASQKGFERGLLVGREVGGVANHIEVLGLESYELTVLMQRYFVTKILEEALRC